MEYKVLIITHLHRIWEERVTNGYLTRDDLHDMLLDQVTGSMDISDDELDAPIARLLGWDMYNLTKVQAVIWKYLVDEAAIEWMYQ